jgi:hypothetical protein
MAKRTDTHRPSAIDPTEYEFVALEYTGPNFGDIEAAIASKQHFFEHMKRTGGRFAGHEHGGTCMVCGAHALYTARFYHTRTNSYITTGLDCAEKLDMGDAITFRNFRKQIEAGREAAAGRAKAQRILADEGLEWAWTVYTAPADQLPIDRNGGIQYEERTIINIVGKLVRYGSISEGQVKFLGALLTRIGERAARDATRVDVPDTTERVTIEGTVLTLKTVETDFGSAVKMLIEHESGFKLYGTVPSDLLCEGLKGSVVSFVARIQRSKDDPKFGFFSRPTKGKVIRQAATVPA